MNETLGNLVILTLQHGNYDTRRNTDPDECHDLIDSWAPHIAFIDLDLYEKFIDIVGRGLTHGHTPIVAFTRRRDTALKLNAYERGADDILEVPFTLDEIVARPFALLRRAHGMTVAIVPKIRLDGLEVDLIEQRVSVGGRQLHLTPIQQSLLYLLAANAGKALSREDLLATIWGGEFEIESNVVDRHIRELRVKLGDEWRAPRYIETVPGAGYRFKAQMEVSSAAQ
ncbi:MAG TPA: response regulator transcription factor [Candidatus Polarisedimenticolia bacterium]|nr:response regulator transcription factor [Candidatus Polarisedimenticolia bacterium]